MTTKRDDSDYAIQFCNELRYRQRHLVNPDTVLLDSMDSLDVELRFLNIFVAYARRWSDACWVVPNMDSVVTKVAAAIKEFSKELHRALILNDEDHCFHADSGEITLGFANWWVRTRHHIACCGSKPYALRDVFVLLNKKVGLLKPEIGRVCACLPIPLFNPRFSVPSFREASRWGNFFLDVEWNLQFLLEKSDFIGPLSKLMKALKENLHSFGWLITASYSDSYAWDWGQMADFKAVAINTAHVCCLCWFAEMDQNLENDVAVFLADLHKKIDLTSPPFLETNLKFLRHEEAEVKGYRAAFVDNMLGAKRETVLHDELLSLITCLVKIPKQQKNAPKKQKNDAHRFSVDIKAVVKEARHLKNKDYRACKTDLVILFARIWFLKAEVFLKKQFNGSTLMLSMKDQIKSLHEGSRFVRSSFTPAMGKTESRILALTEEVPRQVESLCRSSHAKEFTGNKVRDVLYKFLVNIMLFKAKGLLLELLNNDANLMASAKPQIGILHEGLIFIIESEINRPKENTEDEKLILTYYEAVAAGVISFCNSFPAEETTEEAVKNLELWLADTLEMFQLLKAKLKELYLQVPRLNFPKTPGLGFMEFLLQKLKKLLSDKHDSVAHVTHQIEAIHADLEFLTSFFGNVMEQSNENEEQKDVCRCLLNLAYEAECVIDSVVRNSPEWHDLLWLYHVSEAIRHFKMQARDIFEKKGCDIGMHNVPQTLRPLIMQPSTPSINEDVVVLNDQQQVVTNQLIRGSSQRDLISIVGMPGIGKTTLANIVYKDPQVVYHFHIRAWCCVSQVYRKRDLLLNILSHIVDLTDNILAMTNGDLDMVLYKHLKQNRYLVVLDDMWNTEAWNDLQSSFPDDKNGSRILITSRLHDVVSKVALECNLRPLSDDESWELLKIKIFPKEGCPGELMEVGKEIARNCNGLPLSLVAVAGLLNMSKKKQGSWRQIAESLKSLIVGDQQTRCMDVLELSYKHLPDDLKACFLYFGAFEEDKEIPVWKLTWLWIAEGFIRRKDSKSLEELAEDYLMDLIRRSLVIADKRKSNGGVKTCRVHDMVRSLCLLKAKEENFLELITSNDEPYASFEDSVDFDESDHSYSMRYEEYRLCMSVSRKNFVMSRPSGLYVRSLLFFATTDIYPRCSYNISFISENFKLLKVLDLECVNMGRSFADGIELLVLLSYLAVAGDLDAIPPSLAQLRNLETFLVKGLKGKVTVPDSIWGMTRLRHLHVDNYATFTLQNNMSGSSYQLSNLVSLSSPSLSNGEHAEEIIRRLPNLRQLRCYFSKSGDNLKNCRRFPRFEDLTRLESLKILFHGQTLSMGEFNLPLSLKKLTLSNVFLGWDQISTIGRLEKLEVLKLLSVALGDIRWQMREGEFPELKFLKLNSLNIVEWNASSGDLPKLQHLVLQKCKMLKEVPLDFMDIPTLQIIEVQQCGVLVEESVRRLKEEQLGYGIEDLKVLINH